MTSDTSFLAMAASVTWWQILLAIVGGAVIGLASGLVAVFVERVEKLEAEELEDLAEYERENAALIAAAEKDGKEAPTIAPWASDRYGWTWLERLLSPLLAAATFGLFTFHQGPGTALYIHLLWITILVHIVAFDIKHRLILNTVTYPSVVLGLALAHFTPDLGLEPAVLGAFVCWLFFAVQSFVSRGNIGLGDAKLAAVIGAICGLDFGAFQFRALYALIYGVFMGGFVALILLVTRVRGLKDPIPYGPFLCAGAALVLYYGS